jgi:hypothetical protein
MDHLPPEMIYELLLNMIDTDPELALKFCATDKRIQKICKKTRVRKMIIDKWTDIVNTMRLEARKNLEGYYDDDEIEQLVGQHLQNTLPGMPEWLALALNII